MSLSQSVSDSLRTLLWWGTVVAVLQLVPLLFISSVTGALKLLSFLVPIPWLKSQLLGS
jgi:hypothetical protein